MEKFIPIIIFSLRQAIQHVPGLAVDIAKAIQDAKGDPAAASWAALQAKYGGQSYESRVPDSGLIPTPPQQ
jgi:hypothetical protein